MIAVFYNPVCACPFTSRFVKMVVEKAAQRVKKIKGEVEINVVGGAEIKKINYLYRRKNQETDVLSFAWNEERDIKSNFLGQIYICYPQIVKQAKEVGASVQEEFVRMLAHGLLHLVGYDHVRTVEAEKMFSTQEKIVQSL